MREYLGLALDYVPPHWCLPFKRLIKRQFMMAFCQPHTALRQPGQPASQAGWKKLILNFSCVWEDSHRLEQDEVLDVGSYVQVCGRLWTNGLTSVYVCDACARFCVFPVVGCYVINRPVQMYLLCSTVEVEIRSCTGCHWLAPAVGKGCGTDWK